MGFEYRCSGTGFWSRIAVVAFLVLFAGMMSGLTLGLMSMSLVDLEVLAKSGTPNDRKHATKILPVVKRQHLLLCTLLICNAAAMETLPMFLDSLVPAWGAILISVTLILLFGEIIPQAFCSRYGLAIGATLAPVVQVLVVICFPIAYPISKLLDFFLGTGDMSLFRRSELETLVDLHGNEAGKGGELTRDETTIISGALQLTGKTAGDAMTPISETFSVDIYAKLDRALMRLILEQGHSRVPVYHEQPRNIIGLVMVKNLLTVHPEDEVHVKNVSIRKIPRVSESMPLYDILNEFQKGHSHMAVVIRDTTQLARENATHVRDVRVDIDGERHPSKICLKNKGIKKSKSSLSGEENFRREDCKSKKWSNGVHSEVLHIDDSPLTALTQGEAVGIITLEDVIEEILQEEIFDETDYRYECHH